MNSHLAGKRVVVTGASGFIGRRLVQRLVQDGAEVTALVRSPSAAASVPDGARSGLVSLLDTASLARAMDRADVLFHLAYDVRASADENLRAFDATIDAAIRAGIGRIVHTSSIVVQDDWPERDCTESGTTSTRGGSPYRQAKIAMEERLAQVPLPAAILRPTIVWGPGSALWTDGFARALLGGGVVLPDPIGLCNGVFVDDLVQAFLLAAGLPDLTHETFIISGPQPFSWAVLVDGYARILETPPAIRVPADEIARTLGPEPDESDTRPSAAARISALGRRVLGHRRFETMVAAIRDRVGRQRALYPNHHLFREYMGHGTCHIDHARNRLGYRPEYDLARGLTACEPHLRALKRRVTPAGQSRSA
ncbi:nucleoside-diphosphate-sugar epimerase [Albidovulum inexpectatum]|uniref:Nucleoside-diphosphate-sugar epimerase n=1 Tax=Albidovulum inexpectatum TaxID=196587 RepID=A0A2S5JJF4_9RHOB|nr:NAD(P)-dependent oxidoreductase [Albidovulum inexpectatum]PPB81590.1 nucleoside-diphosphate-sugar epimerase [Albidovulum inexpectatum]